ncbi:hypothetical protein A6F68_01106 [Tsuneonella dongtanensis]|uniref:Uncharacterized protein n=1 Tax=Tsuneonella dongtanensis TaxID=692370 RepID=A0A1B2AC46_9SPHN|nr:hypothetical protein A6F68_01106 [Tsuneonella dongtanensis]
MRLAILALASLVPAMFGTPPDPKPATLVSGLCSGGSLEIPLPARDPLETPPCAQKGCHAGCSRKRGLM